MSAVALLDDARVAPPLFSEDAEQAVLSALMQAPEMVPPVRSKLAVDDFFVGQNACVYRAILGLAERGAPVDPLALCHELQQRGELERVGGKEYIGYLSDAIPTAANVEYHAGIVVGHAQRRAAIDTLSQSTELLRSGRHSVADVVGSLRPALDRLTTAGSGQRFPLLTAEELAAIPQAPPLVDGLLFAGGFSSVVAPYDSFKSFVALDLSLCIAKGLDFHGLAVTPGPTVYQASEGGAGLAKRELAWRTLNGVPDAGDIRFLPNSLKLNADRDLADFLAALRALPDRPVLVTIDTFARSHRGNENSAEDTGTYIEAVDRIREEIGAHVQIVHHTGVEGTRSRGSTNIPASLDTEITLDKDGDRVTLRVTKQKDAPPIGPMMLEALPVAGSLAFRSVGLNTSALSQNERAALQSVPRDGRTAFKDWERDSGVPHSSFARCIKRLADLGYVKKSGGQYALTDAGRMVL